MPIIFVILLSFICPSVDKNSCLIVNNKCIKLEVANNETSREKGLSGRTELKSNRGMLFSFEYDYPYCFWMKDMKFAIDIIWLDSDKNIIKIQKNAQPNSYPVQFCPTNTAKYVIELNAGQSDNFNLSIGQKLRF